MNGHCAVVKHLFHQMKQDFLSLLRENSDAIMEESQWRKVKGLLDRDPRYKAVSSSSKREEIFTEYVKSLQDQVQVCILPHSFPSLPPLSPPPLPSPQDVNPEQMRQERIQASLKEREREVQLSRSVQEKEWGRERDQLRKMDAQQNFKDLLVDMVCSEDRLAVVLS